MVDLARRVTAVPNICGIELAFGGILKPSTIEGYQIFNNSIPAGTDFARIYSGKASVNFSEDSDKTAAGIVWKQKLTFRFPASDKVRAERLELVHHVRFIKIKLDSGRSFVLGRNDFKQNARPVVDIKVTDKLAQVEIATRSIFATGYIPEVNTDGLPVLFPINFINED